MRGHIKQRSKGSWTLWMELDPDPATGNRRRLTETIRGTKREAEKRLAELVHNIDTGGYRRPPGKLTVGEYLKQWLADYASTGVRSYTCQEYQNIVVNRLIPALGNHPLGQLQPSHLQSLYSRLLRKGRRDGKGGLSPKTVGNTHRIMSEALSHAVRWGLVGRNVALAIDPPRSRKKEMEVLSAEKIHALLEASRGTQYFAPIHLALFTGMRRSEVLGLRWSDVDLPLAAISVNRVLHVLKGGRVVFEEPKSARSRRNIPLTPESAMVLRGHREKQERDAAMLGHQVSDEDLVFAQADGRPMLPNSLTHAYLRIARRVGIHGVRLHDLRHTHASLMLKQGVHPKIVSERLGHANIAITLDTYSHVMPGLQAEAAKRFDEVLAAEFRRFCQNSGHAPATGYEAPYPTAVLGRQLSHQR